MSALAKRGNSTREEEFREREHQKRTSIKWISLPPKVFYFKVCKRQNISSPLIFSCDLITAFILRTSMIPVPHCANRQPKYMPPAMASHLFAQSLEIPATFLQSQTRLRSMRIALCTRF